MSRPSNNSAVRYCPGPSRGGHHRRAFLQAGLAGFATLSLPGMLRLRRQSSLYASEAGNAPPAKKAVILVWQPGGCSHIDSYDPKPEAGSEYRGPFGTIATKVPGMRFTELLPRQASIANHLTVLRSMRHGSAAHGPGTMRMLSGDLDTRDKSKPSLPDWMSVSSYLRSLEEPRREPLPAYVSVNPLYERYVGPAYLGDAYSPFAVTGDPNSPSFSVPNIGLSDAAEVQRLGRRSDLRRNLDQLDRAFDRAGELAALDEFETQAMTLLTSAKTKRAFDLTREDDHTRDRYGRNSWGQQLLLARRLVEAGVDVLTTSLSGPLCGRVQNWDDHSVNHNIFDAMRFRAEAYDQAVSALIEDVYERGLDQRVLVVVTGEFGRSPKIEHSPSTGGGDASAPAGTVQPGRGHWPRGFSNLWAGGGIETGRVIGATDKRGADAVERICTPDDFLATIYHHLGIDYAHTTIRDFNGRPTPIVDRGKPIPELMG